MRICAPHKKDMDMKFKIIAIFVLFCNLHVLCACGNNWGDGSDSIKVEVKGDSDIVVADLFPDTCKIYGDKVNGICYGGEAEHLFKEKQEDPNNDKFGIKVCREEGRVLLKIKYAELEDSTEIRIYSAEEKTPSDYYPGKQLVILLKRDGSSSSDPGWANKQDLFRLEKKVWDYDKELHVMHLLMFSLVSIILVEFVVGFVLFIQNRKKLRKFSKEISDWKELVGNREKKEVPVSSHQVVQQKEKEMRLMTDDDIKSFVVEQIRSLQTQFIQPISQPIMMNSKVNYEANHVRKECSDINTDDVKYHSDDNSFTLEQTNMKIFRIYSKKGEYYYTIVDDLDVRKQLAAMLQELTKCLTYQTTEKAAERVEPVTDGKLIKVGDRFCVDDNNKLAVKYV